MIQHHVLWKMDGRTWIEVAPEQRTAVAMSAFGHAVDKGWATIIPAHLMVELVMKVEDYDRHTTDDATMPNQRVTADNWHDVHDNDELAATAYQRGDVPCRVCGNPTGACDVPGACG